jgi:hypothetical protein
MMAAPQERPFSCALRECWFVTDYWALVFGMEKVLA